jgi:NADPH:quinone reductase
MAVQIPAEAWQLRSLVRPDRTLELSLDTVPVPQPGPSEVLIRIEAAPVNPSDLGLLLAGADVTAAASAGTPDRPVVTAPIPDAAMRGLTARVGAPMPVGNEGAGTVVAAGASDAAQQLLGKKVAAAGGAMYAQYRAVDTAFCLELPPDATAADGASAFVNPMTALGMIETMQMEGHVGLVHTAAASNLGQMLNRLCREDQIPLVNIVRKPEQEELLRAAGAAFVCNSSQPEFMDELTAALMQTGATLAFDATGGGKLASQILSCMEAAANATAGGYSRYGSTVHKQVYIYGSLDFSPTVIDRKFGLTWGVGGYLLTNALARLGGEVIGRMRARVLAEATTTFASGYTQTIGLREVLETEVLAGCARRGTGAKYLIDPSSDRST